MCGQATATINPPNADHFQLRGNIKSQSVQEFQAYRKDSNIAQYLKVSSRCRC